MIALSSPMFLQIIVVTALVVGAVFAGRYWWHISASEFSETASPAKRKEAFINLQSVAAKLTNYDTAGFLLDAAKDLYDRKHSALDTLDEKAQKWLGLVGGGAGLFTLLSGLGGAFRPQLNPFVVIAIACFLLALLALMFSLKPVSTDIPTVSEFNSLPVLNDPNSRARIAWRLIDAWQEITLSLTPYLRRKGRLVFASSALIAVGATFLILNFIWNLETKPATATDKTSIHLSCKVPMKQSNTTVDCEASR